MYNRTSFRRPVLAAVVLSATLAVSPNQARTQESGDTSNRVVADLGKYCTVCWRNASVPMDLWGDCTQDVLQRLLERVPAEAWEHVFTDETNERREFLRAIDTVKKRARRAKRLGGEVEGVADTHARNERQLAEEREVVRRASAALLTSRQQQILQQSLEGASVNDIATALALPPARVSDEKYKAINKLRSALCERELACGVA